MSSTGTKVLEQVYGAISICGMLSMAGYGITSAQVYMYFTTYFRDPTILKAFVWFIYALDTLHTALVCHVNYHYITSAAHQPAEVFEGVWSLFAASNIDVIMGFFVKCFFLTRVYQICWPRWRLWVTSVIMILVLAGFICGLIAIIRFYLGQQVTDIGSILPVILLYITFNLASDIAIAVVLVLCLKIRRTGHGETNSVINRILLFTANRFLFITIINVLEAALVFLPLPEVMYANAMNFLIVKVLANAVLATLNSRYALRGRGATYTTDDDTTTDSPTTAEGPRLGTSRILSLMQMGSNTVSVTDIELSGGSCVLRSSDLESSKSSIPLQSDWTE